MRPYIAILKDSFREALASRVLWMLITICLLILAALFGFGMDERASTQFLHSEITNAKALADSWYRDAKANARSTGAHIWSLLDTGMQDRLADLVKTNAGPEQFTDPVFKSLRILVAERNLYKRELWQTGILDTEVQLVLDEGLSKISNDELAHFNRILLERTYSQWLAPGRLRELHVTYYGMDIPTHMMPTLRREYLIRSATNVISAFFLGFMGVFAGLIVTGAVIPQTFEAGAVDLLLSKPIHRVGLYLTKYIGGCAFILIIAVILLGGMFLLVWFRHGIWMPSLLVCIPIYLFWFMVFYSLSALVGLVWRNTIVAIAVTISFWAFCALLTLVKNRIIETMILDPTRMTRLIDTEKDLFAANDLGQVYRWSSDDNSWDEILEPDNRNQLRMFNSGLPAGPIWNPKSGDVLTVQRTGSRIEGFMRVASPVVLGNAKDKFRRHEGVPAPAGTELMFQDRKGRMICVGLGGIYALNGSPYSDQARGGIKVLGFETGFLAKSSPNEFQLVSPKQRLTSPLAIAHDPQTDAVAIFQRESLQLFTPDERGNYKETAQRDVRNQNSGLVAICGKLIILGYGNGTFETFETETLKQLEKNELVKGMPPRQMLSSPNGEKCAVVLHDRTLWIYDVKSDRWTYSSARGQEDISCVAWNQSDQLWVVDDWHRATLYRFSNALNDSMYRIRSVQNPRSWLEGLMKYVLRPMYIVLPKPGATEQLTSYILTDEKTIPLGAITSPNLKTQRLAVNIRDPLVSHTVFLFVMLGLGCWYIERMDY